MWLSPLADDAERRARRPGTSWRSLARDDD
jgi:hypothetical protein